MRSANRSSTAASPAGAIHGQVAPGFEPVREAFAHNFATHGDVGAAVCVRRGDEVLVDLWAGAADVESGRPWQPDTLAVVFSTTKGITALVVHRLVERGVLDLDAPIARYWPEFAAEEKQAITLRDVLAHRAGLAAVEGALTLDEVLAWHPVCAAIAAQRTSWEPGTKHGYHLRSFGWILGEVVRRASGTSLGELLAREIAGPLGADFHLGLPEALEPRVATLVPPEEPDDPQQRALRERFLGPDTLLGRALAGPSGLFSYGPMWNTRALHAAQMPSSNGIASARGVAKLYAATVSEVDGRRLLAPATVERARAVAAEGPDAVLLLPTRFGLGFMRPPTLSPSCPERCFGHPGAGGSLGFADPETGLGFGYVMNRMKVGLAGDERSDALVAALYESLEG